MSSYIIYEMDIQLLKQSIDSILIFQKSNVFNFSSPTIKKKLNSTMHQLELKASEVQQPIALLIRMYAHYYINVFKAKSSNMILLKVNEFIEKSILNELPKFLDNDIELAYDVENSWNSLHYLSSIELPFQVRALLGKNKIKIMDNTFFRHSSEFHYFCIIAKFINEQKLHFPQIHSIKEFFLHLPIILRKPGNYLVYQFLNCEKSLEKYYNLVYGYEKSTDRLSKFLNTLTKDSLEYLKNSQIWCKQVALDYLSNEKGL